MSKKNKIIFLLLMLIVLSIFTNCTKMKENAKKRTMEKYAWVEYDGNGATIGEIPIERKYIDPGEFVFIKDNVGNFQKSNYSFDGWNTNADGSGKDYAAGTYFLMGYENITLYAQWIE